MGTYTVHILKVTAQARRSQLVFKEKATKMNVVPILWSMEAKRGRSITRY